MADMRKQQLQSRPGSSILLTIEVADAVWTETRHLDGDTPAAALFWLNARIATLKYDERITHFQWQTNG